MPPVNDNRADAIVITLPYSDSMSTAGATEEVGEPLPGQMSATMWFRFTISETLKVSISLEGSDYDTYLALYELGASTALASNDDTFGMQSFVSRSLDPGTYEIQVGGYNGSTGNASLSVSGEEPPPPPETVGRISEAFDSGPWSLSQLVAPLSEGYFVTLGGGPDEPFEWMAAFRLDPSTDPATVVEVDRLPFDYPGWIPTGFVQTAENHVVVVSLAFGSLNEDKIVGFKFDPVTETLSSHPNPIYEPPYLSDVPRGSGAPRTMPVARRLGDGTGVVGLSIEYDSIPDPWNLATLDFTHDSGNYRNPGSSTIVNPDAIFDGFEDISFKPDGTKLWAMRTNRAIYSWDLTTPWDLRSTVNVNEVLHTDYDPPGNKLGESDVGSIWIKPDGTRLYGLGEGPGGGITGAVPPSVIQWDTTTPWVFKNSSNIPDPTASRAGEFVVSAQASRPTGITFKDDGTRMYILDWDTRAVYQYDLSTAWDVTTASYAGVSPSVMTPTADEVFVGYQPVDIEFRSDGLVLYALDQYDSRLRQYGLGTAWDITTLTGGVPDGQSVSDSLVNRYTPAGGFWIRPDGAMMFVVRQDNFRSYDTVSRYDFGDPRTDFGVHFVSWSEGEPYPSLDHYHAIEGVAVGNINETALDTFNGNEVMVAIPLASDGGDRFYTVDPVGGVQMIGGPFFGSDRFGIREYSLVDGKAYWWGYINGSDASHILSRAPDGEFQVVYTEDNVANPGDNSFQAPLMLDDGTLATMQVFNEDGPRKGYNAIVLGRDDGELPATPPGMTDEKLLFIEPFPSSGFLYGASPACDPVPAGGLLWHKFGWDNYEGDNNLHQMRFVSISSMSFFINTGAQTRRFSFE